MAKLSVIVCVYNTDKNLFENCLKSIFRSSLECLEVVVVDDGSTISYEDLVKSFSGVKYYKTKNQGTLKSRLYGLGKATGDYICFVDSDDEVSSLYHEAMLKKIEETKADICFNDWGFLTENARYVCMNDSTIKEDFCIENKGVLAKYFSKFGTEHSYYVLWNKIFKKEVLEFAKEKIEKLNFDKLLFAEDVLISFYAFLFAKKIVNTHVGYYFYHIHSGQEIEITSGAKLLEHGNAMASVFYAMESELKNSALYQEHKEMFLKWKSVMAWSDHCHAMNIKVSNADEIIKNTYGVSKIKNYRSVAEKGYSKHYLLPKNFLDIDQTIYDVFKKREEKGIFAKKYALYELKKINKNLEKKFILEKNQKRAEIVMPNEVYSVKLKLCHNFFVYSIGKVLFPKGSKIRKKLKSKL